MEEQLRAAHGLPIPHRRPKSAIEKYNSQPWHVPPSSSRVSFGNERRTNRLSGRQYSIFKDPAVRYSQHGLDGKKGLPRPGLDLMEELDLDSESSSEEDGLLDCESDHSSCASPPHMWERFQKKEEEKRVLQTIKRTERRASVLRETWKSDPELALLERLDIEYNPDSPRTRKSPLPTPALKSTRKKKKRAPSRSKRAQSAPRARTVLPKLSDQRGKNLTIEVIDERYTGTEGDISRVLQFEPSPSKLYTADESRPASARPRKRETRKQAWVEQSASTDVSDWFRQLNQMNTEAWEYEQLLGRSVENTDASDNSTSCTITWTDDEIERTVASFKVMQSDLVVRISLSSRQQAEETCALVHKYIECAIQLTMHMLKVRGHSALDAGSSLIKYAISFTDKSLYAGNQIKLHSRLFARCTCLYASCFILWSQGRSKRAWKCALRILSLISRMNTIDRRMFVLCWLERVYLVAILCCNGGDKSDPLLFRPSQQAAPKPAEFLRLLPGAMCCSLHLAVEWVGCISNNAGSDKVDSVVASFHDPPIEFWRTSADDMDSTLAVVNFLEKCLRASFGRLLGATNRLGGLKLLQSPVILDRLRIAGHFYHQYALGLVVKNPLVAQEWHRRGVLMLGIVDSASVSSPDPDYLAQMKVEFQHALSSHLLKYGRMSQVICGMPVVFQFDISLLYQFAPAALLLVSRMCSGDEEDILAQNRQFYHQLVAATMDSLLLSQLEIPVGIARNDHVDGLNPERILDVTLSEEMNDEPSPMGDTDTHSVSMEAVTVMLLESWISRGYPLSKPAEPPASTPKGIRNVLMSSTSSLLFSSYQEALESLNEEVGDYLDGGYLSVDDDTGEGKEVSGSDRDYTRPAHSVYGVSIPLLMSYSPVTHDKYRSIWGSKKVKRQSREQERWAHQRPPRERNIDRLYNVQPEGLGRVLHQYVEKRTATSSLDNTRDLHRQRESIESPWRNMRLSRDTRSSRDTSLPPELRSVSLGKRLRTYLVAEKQESTIREHTLASQRRRDSSRLHRILVNPLSAVPVSEERNVNAERGTPPLVRSGSPATGGRGWAAARRRLSLISAQSFSSERSQDTSMRLAASFVSYLSHLDAKKKEESHEATQLFLDIVYSHAVFDDRNGWLTLRNTIFIPFLHFVSLTIQRVVRGFLVRRRHRVRQDAALTIQRVYFGYRARLRFRREQFAAELIQRKVSLYLLRLRLGAALRLKELLTPVFVGARVRRQQRLLQKSAVRIQIAMRGWMFHAAFMSRWTAAISIQSVFRGILARRQMEQMSRYTRIIQHNFRSSVVGLNSKISVDKLRAVIVGWQFRKTLRQRRKSATMIQSLFRGWYVRVELQRQQDAAALLQRVCRGMLVRRFYRVYGPHAVMVIARAWRRFLIWKNRQAVRSATNPMMKYVQWEARRHAGAKRILAWYRGIRGRRRFVCLRRIVSAMQVRWRSRALRSEYRSTRDSVRMIQRWWRGMRDRSIDEHFQRWRCEQRAVQKIQCWYRGIRERFHLQEQKTAVGKIEQFWQRHGKRPTQKGTRRRPLKCCLLTLVARYRYLCIRRKVLLLQRWWRGVLERKAYQSSLRRIVTLQAVARGFLVRARYREESDAAVCIQRAYRGHVIRSQFMRMRSSARTIGSWWRLCLYRLRGGSEQHAVYLQKFFRRWLAQKDVRRKFAAVVIQRWWRAVFERQSFLDVVVPNPTMESTFTSADCVNVSPTVDSCGADSIGASGEISSPVVPVQAAPDQAPEFKFYTPLAPTRPADSYSPRPVSSGRKYRPFGSSHPLRASAPPLVRTQSSTNSRNKDEGHADSVGTSEDLNISAISTEAKSVDSPHPQSALDRLLNLHDESVNLDVGGDVPVHQNRLSRSMDTGRRTVRTPLGPAPIHKQVAMLYPLASSDPAKLSRQRSSSTVRPSGHTDIPGANTTYYFDDSRLSMFDSLLGPPSSESSTAANPTPRSIAITVPQSSQSAPSTLRRTSTISAPALLRPLSAEMRDQKVSPTRVPSGRKSILNSPTSPDTGGHRSPTILFSSEGEPIGSPVSVHAGNGEEGIVFMSPEDREMDQSVPVRAKSGWKSPRTSQSNAE